MTPGGQVVGYVFVQKLKHAESVVELVSMFRHPGKFGSPYIPFFAQYVRAVIPLACNPTQHAAARITKIHRHEAAMRPAKCASLKCRENRIKKLTTTTAISQYRMESPASEGDALVTFHRSTGGATWARTWDVNGDDTQDVGGATLGRPPHACWHGVSVGDEAGEHWVFSLRLRDIGLNGMLLWYKYGMSEECKLHVCLTVNGGYSRSPLSYSSCAAR